MDHEAFMRMAIESALQGETPFGAVVVTESGRVIRAFNTTALDGPVAHAEMNVLKSAIEDRPVRLYTTGEPCPMCAGAILWHQVKEVYYGVSIPTIGKYLPQIHISCETIFRQGPRECRLTQLLPGECEELFRRYS